MTTKPILGIDLGTYNSAAAVLLSDGQVVTVSAAPERQFWKDTQQRIKPFPSVVVYHRDGSVRAVGLEAKELSEREPELAVWGVKRLLGKTFKEARQHGELDRLVLPVDPDEKNGRCVFLLEQADIQPEDVCMAVLRHIRSAAEAQVGAELSNVVISVPAYFDAIAIGATVEAAKRAGFATIQTILEPVAAALAYDLEVTPRPLNFIVFDLGAGTLDVSAAEVRRVRPGPDGLECRCRMNSGDTHLGGLDMDDRLLSHLAQRLDLGEVDAATRSRLRRVAEEAKVRLSSETEASIEFTNNGGTRSCWLTRSQLEDVLHAAPKDLIESCRSQVFEALRGAHWQPEDVDHLLLVGGPTAMPCLLQMLAGIFRHNPRVIAQLQNERCQDPVANLDPMMAVALGAAKSRLSSLTKIHPYGYGFVQLRLDRLPGQPAHRIHREPCILIPCDSAYPAPPRVVVPPNPFYQRDGIYTLEIIQEVPGPEQEVPGLGQRKYRFLGEFQLAFAGRSFLMQVSMRLNDNGELETTIQNLLGGEAVTYTGVGSLRRCPVELPTSDIGYVDTGRRASVSFVAEKADAVLRWAERLGHFLSDKHNNAKDADLEATLASLDLAVKNRAGAAENAVNTVFALGRSVLHRSLELRLLSVHEKNRLEQELQDARAACFTISELN